MTSKITQALVTETQESPYAVDIEVSGHHIKGDEAIEVGGRNLGPAPYDLLAAALGECTSLTVRWYANQQKWPLDKVNVRIAHHKEGREDIFTKEITLEGDSLTQEQRQKLIEIAAKCPIQRTLEGTPSITTTMV